MSSLAAWLVVCVASLAIAGRAWLLFRSPYIPGVNGAYYLVQARALIERGTLGLPDLPLTFYLHAAAARLLSTVANVAPADAIVLAVKLCDAALPPLIAWPVFVLVRRWAASGNQGLAVPLAAATLACLASPLFRVVGDLQKNSLALVWLALLAVTLHGWLATPSGWRSVAVLATLCLLGLTHVGVLWDSAHRQFTAPVCTAMTELQSLARFIPEPDRTLVVAPHGVEWWSAWFFRTRVAQASALRPADWARYKTVLFLEVKAGQEMSGFTGGGPPGFGSPRRPPPQPGAAPRDGGPPGAAALIPAGADVLHDGPSLRLARVATPPEFLSTRQSVPRVR
jgi:hypothetical protein